jgi:3',5'-cyclic AMP phosphodiesterase CpdA
MLEETGRAGRFRLLLIHHPPAPGAIDWRRALTDAHRLQAVLARRGAELVLHGHSHRWMSASVPGPAGAIPALGIPSASALTRRAGRRAGYALAAITPTTAGWDVEVTRFVLSSDAARFEHGETHRFSRPATTPR